MFPPEALQLAEQKGSSSSVVGTTASPRHGSATLAAAWLRPGVYAGADAITSGFHSHTSHQLVPGCRTGEQREYPIPAQPPHAQGGACTQGRVLTQGRAVPQAAAPAAPPPPPATLDVAGSDRNDLGTAQVIPHLSNKLPNEN